MFTHMQTLPYNICMNVGGAWSVRKQTSGEEQEVPRKVDLLKDGKRQLFWSQMSVTEARNTGLGLPTSMSQHGSGFMQLL